MVDSPQHEREGIVTYVEVETTETVTHAEKITTLGVFGQKHDVWDVHTGESRWWVMTNMTNLYRQDRFRSMDETLSFHIGLMTRLSERGRQTPDEDDENDLLPSAWRRFSQAIDAYNTAAEPEDYQSVAIRCREALLAMVRDLSDKDWLADEPRPKLASFKEWIGLIYRSITQGRLRSYLIGTGEKAWDLAVSLQHDTSADAIAVEILLDATRNIFESLFMAVIRSERQSETACPKCGSVQLGTAYRPTTNLSYPHFVVCNSCGWETQASSHCAPAAADESEYFEKHGDEVVARARAIEESKSGNAPDCKAQSPED